MSHVQKRRLSRNGGDGSIEDDEAENIMSDSPREIDFLCLGVSESREIAVRRLKHYRIELGHRRCGMRPLWWRRDPERGRGGKSRTEDARWANRDATEEHGKPINRNSGESQMEVTPE